MKLLFALCVFIATALVSKRLAFGRPEQTTLELLRAIAPKKAA